MSIIFKNELIEKQNMEMIEDIVLKSKKKQEDYKEWETFRDNYEKKYGKLKPCKPKPIDYCKHKNIKRQCSECLSEQKIITDEMICHYNILLEQEKKTPCPKQATKDVVKEEKDICPICILNYEIKEELIILGCKHVFHSSCIQEWIKLNSTCPICRCGVQTKENTNKVDECVLC